MWILFERLFPIIAILKEMSLQNTNNNFLIKHRDKQTKNMILNELKCTS